jgi:TetR/AcrR family transcriptional regulator, cholesterol catabolism regulator
LLHRKGITPVLPLATFYIRSHIFFAGNFGNYQSFHSFALPMSISDRILTESKELFTRFGIRSVTMDDIANHLGISKKTIYQHFADKDTLVLEVIKGETSVMEQVCSEHCAQAANAIDEIFRIMTFTDELFRNMNPTILFDLEKSYPVAYRVFANHKDHFFYPTIKTNLERGIREGLYRTEIKTDIMAAFRVSSSLLAFAPNIFNTREHTLAEISHEIMEHYLFGIVTEKGYKMTVKYKQDQIKLNRYEPKAS